MGTTDRYLRYECGESTAEGLDWPWSTVSTVEYRAGAAALPIPRRCAGPMGGQPIQSVTGGIRRLGDGCAFLHL